MTDKHLKDNLKLDFINVLGLRSISKIPTTLIIDNIEEAYKKNKPLKSPLEIYREINRRIDKRNNSWAQDINRLNDFPSIYIKHENMNFFQFFEPFKVFRNEFTELYGNEYVGYLSKKFVVNCEKLLNHLNVLEAPDCQAIKRILENIADKYERDNYIITSKEDRNIVINCLREINKNIENPSLKSDFILELQDLNILCNSEGMLLKPNTAILEDNPSLTDQFKEELGTYFVKYNLEYSNLISRLDIKKLSKLVEKKLESKPDVSLLKTNEDYTYKIHWIWELLPRIINENQHLDELEWAEIDPEIKVYQFDDLSVLKYVVWNGAKYNSSNNNISCYIEKKDNEFSKIYVKGSSKEVHKSLTEEIFEEIHPNISKDFKAVIHALLIQNSLEDMEEYLNFVNYAHVEKASNTLLKVDKKVDDNISDENEEFLDEGNNKSNEYADICRDIDRDEANGNKENLIPKTKGELLTKVFDSIKIDSSVTLSSNGFDEEAALKYSQDTYNITDNGGTYLKDNDSTNFKIQQKENKNTAPSTEAGLEREKLEEISVGPNHVDNNKRKSSDKLRTPSENSDEFLVPSKDIISEIDNISKVDNISSEDHSLETDNISREEGINSKSLPYKIGNKVARIGDKKSSREPSDGNLPLTELDNERNIKITRVDDKKLIQEPSDGYSPLIELDSERKINIRETRERSKELSQWVRGLYGYHCQICLAKEDPALLTYPKSYASYDINRKHLMNAHHIKAVGEKGHDHPGNYLSLCKHHHGYIHQIGLTANELNRALKSVTQKEITWPTGRKYNWNLLTFENKYNEDKETLKLVIRTEHLEQLKEYMRDLTN